MTWLTWRQFRVSASAAMIGLLIAAFLLALTPHGALAQCAGASGCAVAPGKFLGLSHDHLLKYLSTALVALPALVGAFWGAPIIARELEAGTYRLAWTQSVTRRRWFATKITIIGLAVAAVCGLLSLMLGAWSSAAVNRGRLDPAMFAERGIAPIGYAVFALAVGVTAGLFIRRTVPAMAVTLFVFLGARMSFQFWVRAHLIALKHTTFALDGGLGIAQTPSGISLIAPTPNIPGAWIISSRLEDGSGHEPTKAFVTSACGQIGPPPAPLARQGTSEVPRSVQHGLNDCITAVSSRFHVVAAYQPASHYWALQAAETAIFGGVGLALIGLCFWWLRHRLA
jgi:ABC-type transport system involved in multi-copper enzyme maturation permease subunit